jgi:hypothetical protein
MVLVGRVMVSWRHQQGSSRGHNTRWESCTAAAADGRRSTWRNWLLAPSQHSANVMRWSRPADAWRAGAATRDLARALQRRAASCMQARACPVCRSPLWCRVRVDGDSQLRATVHHAGGLVRWRNTSTSVCRPAARHDGPSDQSRNNGSPGRTKSSETRLEASEDNFS